VTDTLELTVSIPDVCFDCVAFDAITAELAAADGTALVRAFFPRRTRLREGAVSLAVSVVIPARAEARSIGACLGALARQTVGAPALEVIVVAAGADDTAGAVERAAAGAGFRRFKVVRLAEGNKNVALQAGCPRATAPVVVLLDGDTELEADAVEELARAVADGPERAVHGAPLPRFHTWVSRYWELNRQLTKDLAFDGSLSGKFVALRRMTLVRNDLRELFPAEHAVKGDAHLARALAARGCAPAYLARARGTTLTPWTLRGLARTMLRSRRAAIAQASLADASAQAALSAALVAGVPAALVAARWSGVLAAACVLPLVVYVARLVRNVEALRRSGIGDHRREIPAFLALDLLGRAIKVWVFVERVAGRRTRSAASGPASWARRRSRGPHRERPRRHLKRGAGCNVRLGGLCKPAPPKRPSMRVITLSPVQQGPALHQFLP
jgi:glycosyltransferase involved in cell wall biosynthesis